MRKDISYKELLRTVHDKIPSYISFLLMMKLDFTENVFFYLISYFLRFLGILILCGSFTITEEDIKESKTLTSYLRYLSTHEYIRQLKLTNTKYNIISSVIFVLFCFRMVLYLTVILKIQKKSENISLNKYQIILDHLVFLLYPFILEYLAQVYFSFCFKNTYVFEQDVNKYVNILILVLNSFLIIGYNFNNYLFLNVINRPFSERDVPVRFRYSKTKFWILFLLQNVIMIQALDFYLTDQTLKIYSFGYFCFFGILFICLFLTSLNNYNYNVITNRFLVTISSFCFFSIISEAISRLFGYLVLTKSTLILFNIGKIIVSVFFQYLGKNISNSVLFKVGIKEIFKVNKIPITDNNVYDVFLYMFELMKDIKYSKNGAGYMLLNSIFEHQEKCNLNSCKCKLIQIVPYGKQYDTDFINNLLGRMSFFVESAFIEIDYSNNYELTMLLAEHFCEFKNNPIIAYSMIQTLLFYQGKNLNMEQLLILYETTQKYVEISLKQEFHNASESEANIKILQEKQYREIYISYDKMINIQKMMSNYINIEIDVIKHKGELEETIKIIHNDDSNEISLIKIPFLNRRNIEKIIKRLKNENKSNSEIFNELTNLKSAKLPIEFYYKCFLFCEIFWEGKIKDEILPSLYGFTNDRNLYSDVVNPNIFLLLRQRYIDKNTNSGTKQNSYFTIYKYTKGMSIDYFSESLAQYLGYTQEDLIDQDISVLLPQELFVAHSKVVLRHLISKQNRVFNHIHSFIFDKSRMGINSYTKGSTLPGLGKYLLVISSIELNEKKNIYHLYFTDNYQLISMSMNFKKNFLLDINLVKKYNIDLLDIFSLNENTLKNFILNEKPQMINFKNDLSLLTEEYFVNKLFRVSNKNNTKFKLLDELEKNCSESGSDMKFRKIISTAKKKMELIHNNQMHDKIKFKSLTTKKSKNEIVNNFNKFIQEKINIDYTDKSYKALMDSFYKFKQFNNLTNENSGFNEKLFENIFEIKVYLRFLYDTPFVMVVLEEITKTSEKKTPVVFANNFTNNALLAKATLKKKNMITATINNDSAKTSTISSINLNKISKYNNKKEKNSYVNYIIFIIFLLIFCIFAIYITIIIYQTHMLNNSCDIFLALFYEYEQRDHILGLYSSMISGYFQYLSLVNYSNYFTLDNFNYYIRKTSSDLSHSYHQFYKYYIQYNLNLGNEIKTLYKIYNFSRINLDWEEVTFKSTFMNEGDSMVHLSTSAVTNPNKEEIKEDLKLFFNADYREHYNAGENIIVHSQYLYILYYFSKNYNNVFSKLFKDVQYEIESEYHVYSDKTKNIYIMIESFGLIINFVFCGVLIVFLLITNKDIFKNILKLFLDYTQPENSYTLNNRLDNRILIEKLNQFNYLMKNFNLESLNKYSKIISQNATLLLEVKKVSTLVNNKPGDSSPKNKRNKVKKIDDNINKNQNDQTNNMSKTTNKLLGLNNAGTIVTKLNRKSTKFEGNSKKNLISESFSTTNNLKNNLKEISTNNEETNNEILTTEKIYEKAGSVLIKKIKINIILLIMTLLIIIAFFIVKLYISIQQVNTMSQLFDDFGYVTRQYSLTYYYYNNLCLLIINQKLGTESVFYTIVDELQTVSSHSIEVKTKRLSNYPKTFNVISILNKNDKSLSNEILRNILCEENEFCKMVLTSDYNLFQEGVDVGTNAFFQQIQNKFKDFQQIKNNITKIDDIKIFTDSSYQILDMNLNFIMNMIKERVNNAFLEDVNNVKEDADRNVIIFGAVIIAFLTLMTLFAISVLVRENMKLDKIIEDSTLRLNKAFCFVKLKNMGLSMKTSSFI